MKAHVFTLTPLPEEKRFLLTQKELVHQIRTVLRLGIGEKIFLTDGKGLKRAYEIVRYDDRSIDLARVSPESAGWSREGSASGHKEVRQRMALGAAILKSDHFDWLVQKTAEIGATDIFPLITDRTIKKEVKIDRLRRIAQEAMEQSERSILTQIHDPRSLAELMAIREEEGFTTIVFDTGRQAPLAAPERTDRWMALIGPEGGWSDNERAWFDRQRISRYSLGEGVYRGETAGILAVYRLVNGLWAR